MSMEFYWAGHQRDASKDVVDGWRDPHAISDGQAHVSVELRPPRGAAIILDIPVDIHGGQITTPAVMYHAGEARLISQGALDTITEWVGTFGDYDYTGHDFGMDRFIPNSGSTGPADSISIAAQVDAPEDQVFSVWRRQWQFGDDRPGGSDQLLREGNKEAVLEILARELGTAAVMDDRRDEVMDAESFDPTHRSYETVYVEAWPPADIRDLCLAAGVKVRE